MPVPRALILAAAASAAFAVAGCGSDSADQADTNGNAPVPQKTTASDGTSPVAGTTPCVRAGSEQAQKALPGSTLTESGPYGCVYKKGVQELDYQWIKSTELTKKGGKYPDLYTHFREAAESNKKLQSRINFLSVDVGETAFVTSQYQNPQTTLRWIRGGDLIQLKLTGFAKTDAARKAAVATIVATGKAVDAKQPN